MSGMSDEARHVARVIVQRHKRAACFDTLEDEIAQILDAVAFSGVVKLAALAVTAEPLLKEKAQ